MKNFIWLFITFLAAEMCLEATLYYSVYPSLIYQSVFCICIGIVIAQYNSKEALSITSRDAIIIGSVKHRIIAIFLFLSWFILQASVVGVLGFKLDNAWFLIIPAAVSAIEEELLHKGIAFKFLYQEKKIHYWISALIVSLIFTLYHRQFDIRFISHFIWSMLSFAIYYHWRSLALTSFFHYAHNLVFYFVLPNIK